MRAAARPMQARFAVRGSIALMLVAYGCRGAPRQPDLSPSPAQSAAAPAPSLYAHIPAEIGDFKLTERSVVRGLPTDSLFRYRDSSRSILTVIIYDVPAEVRVDADSQQWTYREGERFKLIQDIQRQRGRLRDYELAFSDTLRLQVGAQSFVQHAIATRGTYASGAKAVDMQYLYLIGGKFVKVRATIPGQEWQQTQIPTFARELAVRLASGIAARR